MSNTRHTFGQVREIPDDVEKTRTVPFILSNGNKDRHRTRMNMDNWVLEHYNENPIVGYQHNVYGGDMCNKPDPDDVIGSGKAYQRNGMLLSDITFETESINPQAEKIFKKVTESKSLRAVSVGIIPIGGGTLINEETGQQKELDTAPWQVPKGHTFNYNGQELLEQSIVNIPSNRGALKRALRSQTANALMYIKKALGDKYSFSDIENMTVRNLMDIVDGKDTIEDETEEQKVKDFVDEGEKAKELKYKISLDTSEVDEFLERNKDEYKESQFVANGLRDIQMRKLKQKKAINKIG